MTLLQDIQGHWQRHWIKAPGFEDHTTRVHWMQAGADFADIRVPLHRPELAGAACLAELSAPQVLALAQAEGFAGQVTLDGDKCTWHRALNWHGTPSAVDVGAISFDDQGRMIEAGVLADYTELWEQRALAAPTALRFAGGGYSGVLVTCGQLGVLAVGRADKPATQPLLDCLKQGHIPEGAGGLFDDIFALCQVEQGQAVATLATQPFAEGQRVLSFEDPGRVTFHKVGFDGARGPIKMRAA